MISARNPCQYLLSAALVCSVQEPDLASFRAEIEPILSQACLRCHGPDEEHGGFRVDELDPDLVQGEDVDLWLDVLSVLSNGEMPPEGEGKLLGEDRGEVIERLSMEAAVAGEWERQNQRVISIREKHADDPGKLEEELAKLRLGFAARPRGTHFESLVTGRVGKQSWHYGGAKFACASASAIS